MEKAVYFALFLSDYKNQGGYKKDKGVIPPIFKKETQVQ